MFTIVYRAESGRTYTHTGTEQGIRQLVKECHLGTHWFAPGSDRFEWRKQKQAA